jgi:hypothetical protein
MRKLTGMSGHPWPLTDFASAFLILLLDCAHTTVRKPPSSAPEEAWYAYHYEQMSLYGKIDARVKLTAPDSTSMEAEWCGYNRARAQPTEDERVTAGKGIGFFSQCLDSRF